MESRLSPMDLMLANNPDQFASYIFTEHGIAVYDPGYRELREDEKELLKHWEENEFTEDHEQQVKNAVYDGLTTSTYLKQSLEAGDKEYLFGTSPKFGEVLDVKKYRLGDPKCVLSKDVPGELKEEYLIVTEKELQLQKKEQEVSWCGNIGGGSMRDTQDYELIGKYLAKHLNLAAAMSTTFQPGERNYLNFKSPEDELRFEQEDENLKDDYGFVYASNGYTNMKYLENSKFNRLYNIIDGVLRNAGEAHNSARCSQLTSVVYQTWIDTKQLDINEIHLKPMARMFASVLANHPDLSVDDLDLYSYPNSVDGNGDFNEEYAVAFYQFLQNFCLNNPPESEAWDKFFSEMEETIGNDMIDIQRDCSWELVM